MPFSLTYSINYALTNSHHSLEYSQKEEIEVDSLFKDITHIGKIPFQKIERPLKTFNTKLKMLPIEGTSETPEPFRLESPKGIGKTSSVVETLDKKLDNINQLLQLKL